MKHILILFFILLSKPILACQTGGNDMEPIVYMSTVHFSESTKEKIIKSKTIEIKEENNLKRVCDQGYVNFKYGIYLDNKKFYLSHYIDDIELVMEKISQYKG